MTVKDAVYLLQCTGTDTDAGGEDSEVIGLTKPNINASNNNRNDRNNSNKSVLFKNSSSTNNKNNENTRKTASNTRNLQDMNNQNNEREFDLRTAYFNYLRSRQLVQTPVNDQKLLVKTTVKSKHLLHHSHTHNRKVHDSNVTTHNKLKTKNKPINSNSDTRKIVTTTSDTNTNNNSSDNNNNDSNNINDNNNDDTTLTNTNTTATTTTTTTNTTNGADNQSSPVSSSMTPSVTTDSMSSPTIPTLSPPLPLSAPVPVPPSLITKILHPSTLVRRQHNRQYLQFPPSTITITTNTTTTNTSTNNSKKTVETTTLNSKLQYPAHVLYRLKRTHQYYNKLSALQLHHLQKDNVGFILDREVMCVLTDQTLGELYAHKDYVTADYVYILYNFYIIIFLFVHLPLN